MTLGLNYRVSRSSFTLPSPLAPSSCGQLAGHTAYLWFLKPAARQDITLPQPSTEWVRVGECVCERIGRCAPLSWKGPKISQQQICRLRNGSFLFFCRSEVLLASFYLALLAVLALDLLGANCDGGEGFRQLRHQEERKQLLGGFRWLAEAQGAQWCCTLLKSTTSSVNTAKQRWKTDRRSAKANSRVT